MKLKSGKRGPGKRTEPTPTKPQNKTVSNPAETEKPKTSNAIDDIFAKKTPISQHPATDSESEEASDIEYSPEETLNAMHLLSKTKPLRLPLVLDSTTLMGNLSKSAERGKRGKGKAERRTDDGLKIYDVNDICTTGGDSPECPFDCSCCF